MDSGSEVPNNGKDIRTSLDSIIGISERWLSFLVRRQRQVRLAKAFLTAVLVLLGIFFGGDAIAGEFQNKTGYFTLPNPVRRSSVYVGKWLAAFIASTAILAIFAAITLANGVF